jgi:hypothetical protein
MMIPERSQPRTPVTRGIRQSISKAPETRPWGCHTKERLQYHDAVPNEEKLKQKRGETSEVEKSPAGRDGVGGTAAVQGTRQCCCSPWRECSTVVTRLVLTGWVQHTRPQTQTETETQSPSSSGSGSHHPVHPFPASPPARQGTRGTNAPPSMCEEEAEAAVPAPPLPSRRPASALHAGVGLGRCERVASWCPADRQTPRCERCPSRARP